MWAVENENDFKWPQQEMYKAKHLLPPSADSPEKAQAKREDQQEHNSYCCARVETSAIERAAVAHSFMQPSWYGIIDYVSHRMDCSKH